MQNLAEAVLDYWWLLQFSEEEESDPDLTLKLEETLLGDIELKWTSTEKEALQKAAQRRLEWWLQEPDENGYTPRKLLTPEQKAFLQELASGQFYGPNF